MTEKHYMVVDLLRAFYWFDDGLQSYLQSRGWPPVPRTHSMIVMNVISGIGRPAEIARALGITRQAVHVTIGQMVEAGMVRLEDDPNDGRSKCVVLSEEIEPMRHDARQAIDLLTQELSRRIGEREVRSLAKAFETDWGPAPDFGIDREAQSDGGRKAPRRRGRPGPAPV